MNAGADPRLLRLLGGEMLAPLRQRLRRRYEQAPPGAQPTVLRLGGLSESEHAALAALLGRPARYAASMQVDVETIDAALRAAGIAPTLHDALEALDGPVLHRAAERERARALWSTLAQGCEPPLRGLLEDPRGLGLVKRLARQDVAVASELCRQVDAVLRCLPARGLPRAQLAAQILGDAHALDDGQPVAALVVAVLREQREGESTQANADDLTEAERRRGRWASAGVLVNELARPALCLNRHRAVGATLGVGGADGRCRGGPCIRLDTEPGWSSNPVAPCPAPGARRCGCPGAEAGRVASWKRRASAHLFTWSVSEMYLRSVMSALAMSRAAVMTMTCTRCRH